MEVVLSPQCVCSELLLFVCPSQFVFFLVICLMYFWVSIGVCVCMLFCSVSLWASEYCFRLRVSSRLMGVASMHQQSAVAFCTVDVVRVGVLLCYLNGHSVY